MSAIAHAPAHALGGAHRVLFLVVALTVLAVAAVTVAVVLFTRDDAASGPLTPNIPGHQVVCQNAPVHSAC